MSNSTKPPTAAKNQPFLLSSDDEMVIKYLLASFMKGMNNVERSVLENDLVFLGMDANRITISLSTLKSAQLVNDGNEVGLSLTPTDFEVLNRLKFYYNRKRSDLENQPGVNAYQASNLALETSITPALLFENRLPGDIAEIGAIRTQWFRAKDKLVALKIIKIDQSGIHSANVEWWRDTLLGIQESTMISRFLDQIRRLGEIINAGIHCLVLHFDRNEIIGRGMNYGMLDPSLPELDFNALDTFISNNPAFTFHKNKWQRAAGTLTWEGMLGLFPPWDCWGTRIVIARGKKVPSITVTISQDEITKKSIAVQSFTHVLTLIDAMFQEINERAGISAINIYIPDSLIKQVHFNVDVIPRGNTSGETQLFKIESVFKKSPAAREFFDMGSPLSARQYEYVVKPGKGTAGTGTGTGKTRAIRLEAPLDTCSVQARAASGSTKNPAFNFGWEFAAMQSEFITRQGGLIDGINNMNEQVSSIVQSMKDNATQGKQIALITASAFETAKKAIDDSKDQVTKDVAKLDASLTTTKVEIGKEMNSIKNNLWELDQGIGNEIMNVNVNVGNVGNSLTVLQQSVEQRFTDQTSILQQNVNTQAEIARAIQEQARREEQRVEMSRQQADMARMQLERHHKENNFADFRRVLQESYGSVIANSIASIASTQIGSFSMAISQQLLDSIPSCFAKKGFKTVFDKGKFEKILDDLTAVD